MTDQSGIDPALAQRLGAPPADDYALLEARVSWPHLDAAQARMAAALRVFVVTRDPLGWVPDRGVAWATANADGDVLELVVYVARDMLVSQDGPAAGIARFAEAAVRGSAAAEGTVIAGAQPGLVADGVAPRLLDGAGQPSVLGPPTVRLRGHDWEPIGLGAIQDLVQEAFGPVDFDRSLVRLPAAETLDEGCPACRGQRFGFPGDLEEGRLSMCSAHAAAARAETDRRIARARRSNPLGWRAIGKASARISGLPEPVGTPLPTRVATAVGRNDPCPCGSGRKYKRCCGA
ncbi:MAG: SEC-C metal-binding domain-containing protein [Solirubrobacteraceae bacterium]